MELAALIGHLHKSGEAECPSLTISGLPCDVPAGDIHQKKNYMTVLQNYIDHNQRYHLPMAMQAQEFMSIYQKQINRLEAASDAVSQNSNISRSNSRSSSRTRSSGEAVQKIGPWRNFDSIMQDFFTDEQISEHLNRPVPPCSHPFQEHEDFAAENQHFDLSKELTKEELTELKGKYDLENMTPESYQEFIEDLCRMDPHRFALVKTATPTPNPNVCTLDFGVGVFY